AVGSEPRAVASADFDRDGNADLAVANVAAGSEGGSVSILLGKGDGTFLPETRLPAGEVLAELLAGDFDADGRPDLALASTNRRDVSVHLGNGDGAFKPRAAYEVNGGPVSMAAGDFNGDGKPDLVIIGTLNPDLLTQGPGMRVLLNRGDGTFDAGGFVMFGAAPRSVRAGDFNGDGKSDLALAYETAGVSVLPGNGNGTFGSPVNFDLGRPVGPRHAAPADFNNDGKLDLLAVDAAYSSANLHVLLGNGDFTFRKASSFGGGSGSGGGFIDPLAFKDFNGDGKLDLIIMPALSNQDGMGAYLGNGDGTFVAANAGFTGYGLRALSAGDFNNDGRPDAVLARSNSFGGFQDSRNLSVMVNVSSAPAFKFGAQNYSASEKDGAVTITVTRTGDLSGAASVGYSTSSGQATDRGDFTAALGTLRFAPGESSKTFSVFITADALAEPNESFTVGLGNPAGASVAGPSVATVTITNDAGAPAGPNPLEDTTFFVRQHYRDFLNRDPDAPGLAFWTGEIEQCGADAQCREVKRINVSAAFFLSIEFQDTGFYVYRLNQAAFNTGESLRLRSFLPDTQEVGRGLVVGAPGWEEQLLANKRAFVEGFVARPAFAAAYPASLTPAQFVDALNANTRDPLNPSAGGALSQTERDALAAQLAAAGDTPRARADVLRAVAENAEFRRRQSNTAFVLMQYFGYLRRDPNDPPDTDYAGHGFWLSKLNEFGGDFVRAEMVKAFINSDEYRKRFGQ
ncbi:MAG TPA: FG-GAP-like repeat-containing protein, partial [Pyrinomonadaceae bacterium]